MRTVFDQGDHIPFDYEVGQQIIIQMSERGHSVPVSCVVIGRCTSAGVLRGLLIRDNKGHHYTFDNATAKLTKAEASTEIDKIFEYETNQTQEEQTMNVIAIKTLASWPDGTQVECVEGVLASLWEAKTGISEKGVNKGKPWSLQNGVIRDMHQDEHRITFATPDVAQPMSNKGKMVRISCKVNTKGMSGLKLKIGEYNGNETRDLWVTDTAKIEFLGAGGEPMPQQAPRVGQAAPTQPGASSVQGVASGGRSGGCSPASTVATRVTDYFKVLQEVYAQYSKFEQDPEAPLIPGLTPAEIKDIATHISMTYRGDYGCYMPPIFVEGQAQSTGSTPLARWQDFLHAKKTIKASKDVRLGDLDDVELSCQIAWALTAKADGLGPEAAALRGQLILASAEKGWSPRDVLTKRIGASKEYESGDITDDGVNLWSRDKHDCEFMSLDDEQCIRILTSLTGALVEMKAATETAHPITEENNEIPD